jgi:hypothetical protein
MIEVHDEDALLSRAGQAWFVNWEVGVSGQAGAKKGVLAGAELLRKLSPGSQP